MLHSGTATRRDTTTSCGCDWRDIAISLKQVGSSVPQLLHSPLLLGGHEPGLASLQLPGVGFILDSEDEPKSVVAGTFLTPRVPIP